MKRTFYHTIKPHFVSKMMHLLLFICVFAPFTSLTIQAQESLREEMGRNLQILEVTPIHQSLNQSIQGILTVDPTSVYSNVTTFAGSAFSNGGSEVQSGNTITRLVADSLGLSGTAPFSVTSFTFTVSNLNTVDISARPRVRFYNNDNPAGGPGTAIAGFSYNPITFTTNSVIRLNTGALTTPFAISGTSVWAAITFDNNTGATGATQAQLDLLGQGIYNPVDRGSSTDGFFRSNAAGSFFSNNPPSAFGYFGGTPAANFGWELNAPASVPVELMTFTARQSQQKTLLQWETASEINNKGFQIERQEGANAPWNVIGFVPSKNKGAKYEFIDNAPLSINYYRLRQMDYDGKYALSKVVSVSFKAEKTLKVYPSIIANGFLTVETTETSDFAIFNTLGQQVMRGKSVQNINVSTLPQGTYVLKVGDAQAKFVKQ